MKPLLSRVQSFSPLLAFGALLTLQHQKRGSLLKVLMLGWELPPHYVGGMGIVCDQLTRTMARQGADIEFVLPFYADYSHITHMKVTPALEQDARTLMKSGGTYDSMLYEVTNLNGKKYTRTLYEQVEAFAANVKNVAFLGEYDVIHAHDWLTLRAGIDAFWPTALAGGRAV